MIIRRIMGLFLLSAVGLGCASTVPEPKFMPEKSENVFPFFTKGQPIAAVHSTGAFMLVAIEPTVLANQRYFRLWLLYQNTSEEPYLLEPLEFTTLTVTSPSKEKTGSSKPESPTKILAHISNDKALSLIMQAIGGSLEAMAAGPTKVETRFNDGSSASTTIYDQKQKRDVIADRTADAMANTAAWYEIYQNSISDGILRRNTVFPGQSVNGYIYFPFPTPRKFEFGEFESYSSRAEDFLRVDLDLPADWRSIYFTPIEGE
jgi:hypothetical protein